METKKNGEMLCVWIRESEFKNEKLPPASVEKEREKEGILLGWGNGIWNCEITKNQSTTKGKGNIGLSLKLSLSFFSPLVGPFFF